tara:strand:- start:4112 stop:4267 length:156 start_codon:yes stop_codon:yes gene_type:complete
LDQTIQNTILFGSKPLFTLAVFVCFGSFFAGALITAIKRGIEEEGWFKPRD